MGGTESGMDGNRAARQQREEPTVAALLSWELVNAPSKAIQ